MPIENLVIAFGALLGITATAFAALELLHALHDRHRERDLVFLQVVMPKKESKEDKEIESEQFSSGRDFREVIGVMDHLFQSLHSIRSPKISTLWTGQHFIAVEYAALAGEILFYVVCPRPIVHLLEKQITSFYPDAVIDTVEDYNIFTDASVVAAQQLLPTKPFTSSIKTYQQLKSDPLNAITNAFSKFKVTEGAAVQIVLRPVKAGWQQKLHKEAQKIINPKKGGSGSLFNPLTWIRAVFDMFTTGKSDDMEKEHSTGERVSQLVEEYSKSIDEKREPRLHGGHPPAHVGGKHAPGATAPGRRRRLVRAIQPDAGKQPADRAHAEPQGNHRAVYPQEPTQASRRCDPFPQNAPRHRELASLWHFPSIKYNKMDTIKWQNYKFAPAPKNVPADGMFLGMNAYRGEKRKIYMNNEDRFRHFYIIGQTGTGKSSIIQLMARQDFHSGKGLCIIDPHGSLIEDLMPYIPRERANDVIYFNPSDMERPMGLNLLEGKTPEERDLIALDAMNMMVKMFGEEIFGPRIQDYFRNGCLTLMEDEEEGGAITDLVKLFTDDEWQSTK